MKLVVISNMAHYRRADGVIVGHGATARELDALAELFTSVRHVACLHAELPPASALPYAARNIELVPVPPAGGETLGSKLNIVRLMPRYARTIHHELRGADVVHVRCPANVSLCALAILTVTREPRRRWIKYAGSWQPIRAEPASYALQRRWLARSSLRAEVTINGSVAGQPAHVHSFRNPSLTDAEVAHGREAAAMKPLAPPLRLAFVGHLGEAKNPAIAIEVVRELQEMRIPARLDLAADGADLARLRTWVVEQGLRDVVTLHGALPRPALAALYASAHFVVLPSRTEGWPKVLSEGMAAGALPVATAVGSIPEMLHEIGAGRAIAGPPTASAFARAIQAYVAEPEVWRQEIQRGLVAAETFSYRAYQASVRQLLDLP